MKLDLLPDVLVNSAVLGSVYALIALGWVFIYRASRVFNFATGQFLLFGTYLFFWLSTTQSFPIWVAILGAVVLTGVTGAIVYYVLLKPLAGQPIFTAVILTLGLAIVMTRLVRIVWGSGPKSLRKPTDVEAFQLPGGAVLTNYGVVTIAVTLLVFGGLILFLRRSRLGVQMRAAAEQPLLASQTGIQINRVFAVSWAIAVAVAALAGFSHAYTTVLNPDIEHIGIRGIAPALVGGLDSVGGALVGGLLVAVVENVLALYLGPQVRVAAAFFALFLVLILRPSGLFGTAEIRRV